MPETGIGIPNCCVSCATTSEAVGSAVSGSEVGGLGWTGIISVGGMDCGWVRRSVVGGGWGGKSPTSCMEVPSCWMSVLKTVGKGRWQYNYEKTAVAVIHVQKLEN